MNMKEKERYFFEVSKNDIPLVRALLKENNIMFRLITSKVGLFIVRECDGNAVTIELFNNKIDHVYVREIKLPEDRPLSGISDLPSDDLVDIWNREYVCKLATNSFSGSPDSVLKEITHNMLRSRDLEYAGISRVTDKILFVVSEFMLLTPDAKLGIYNELCGNGVYSGGGVDTHYTNLRRFFKWLCVDEVIMRDDYIYILDLLMKRINN